MSRKHVVTAMNNYERFHLNNSNGDKAHVNKVVEVLCRDIILKNGITSVTDVKTRGIKRMDARRGNNIKIEIKCGCGAVNYRESDGMGGIINPFSPEDKIPQNILPRATYVLWYPSTGIALNTDGTLNTKAGFMFTREQFINCLIAIGARGRGLASSLTITKQGGQLQIQTLTNGAFDKLYDFLETYAIPTMAEWLK